MKQNVIIKPIITEKSMMDAGKGVYTFAVSKKATKDTIKLSVENLFQVNVITVTTHIIKGTKTRFTRLGKNTSDESYKKARITLKKGEKIGVFEEVTDK